MVVLRRTDQDLTHVTGGRCGLSTDVTGFDSVVFDTRGYTREAVQHLVDQGNRRIAMITGEVRESSLTRARLTRIRATSARRASPDRW